MSTSTPSSGPATGQSSDENELADYGYKQELKRSLSPWAVFALGFATISPVVGIYAVIQLGFAFTGPAWIWAVLIAFIGQLFVAVVYAQLSSQFPIAGGVYQWVRRLAGPKLGWMTGWVYLAAAIASLSTVAYLGGGWMKEFIGDTSDNSWGLVLYGAVFLLVALGVNLLGVNPVKHFLSAGIIAEGVASIVVSLLLLMFFMHNDFGTLFETLGAPENAGVTTLSGVLTCLAVAGWAFLGFDATTQVAEEAHNPRHTVPRAMLRSFLFVGITVLLSGAAVTLALQDPIRAVNGEIGDPVLTSVTEAFGAWSEKPFIAVVLIAFFACAISIQTYIGRMVFSFARDKQIPFSKPLSRIGKKEIPYVSLIATAVLATLGLLLGLNGNAAATLISFGSGGFYIVFLIVAAVALWARLTKRWDPSLGSFKPGRFGLVINVLAVIWLLFEVVNVAWPRAELAPVDGTWVQIWAVILVFSALIVIGIVYLAVQKPHLEIATPAQQKETNR
ncbi:APC family permease [Lysinibacter cavernae]|uniref:Amino acid transporter n=1 Tax=Lysinibacter cavernae TaxID=1640652 RepID=A0A7X5TTY9_9MICO|nr:APC family permease [Lysinibacter cavernae]NIH54700.1 amino acid transporter [Lysinibacter cavernae]